MNYHPFSATPVLKIQPASGVRSPLQLVLLSALVALVSCQAFEAMPTADAPRPQASVRVWPADAEILAVMRSLVADSTKTGMVIGVVEPDGSRRVLAHGRAYEGGPPVDSLSVFEIGSITKSFTGILLADAVRRGEVRLEDPLTQHLPAVRMPARDGKEITLLHLITHSAGMSPGLPNLPRPITTESFATYTAERLYEAASRAELISDPGTPSPYSNYAALVGHALAARTGSSYPELLRQRILAPLGMQRTTFYYLGDPPANMTKGHNSAGQVAPYFSAPAFYPSGGIVSTAADMLKYAAANLGGSSPLHDAMRESHRPRVPILNSTDYYGLGWGTDTAGTSVGFSGGTIGQNSFIHVDHQARRAIVVLANVAGNSAQQAGVRILQLADARR